MTMFKTIYKNTSHKVIRDYEYQQYIVLPIMTKPSEHNDCPESYYDNDKQSAIDTCNHMEIEYLYKELKSA